MMSKSSQQNYLYDPCNPNASDEWARGELHGGVIPRPYPSEGVGVTSLLRTKNQNKIEWEAKLKWIVN